MSGFPRRPWAWVGSTSWWGDGHVGEECFVYDPAAIRRAAVAALPADPVEFLLECAAWWAWLEIAGPDEITRHPQDGHRRPGPLERADLRDGLPLGLLRAPPPQKPQPPRPQVIDSGELLVPEFRPGLHMLGVPGWWRRDGPPQGSYGPRTPKPEIEPKGQG